MSLSYYTDPVTKAVFTYISGNVNSGVVATTTNVSGNVTLPSSFIVNNVTYNVKIIGNNSFTSNLNVTSIEIPSSVTSILLNAFQGCANLSSITIPNSVTNISTNAFKNCTSLTSITIPDSVTTFGTYIFQGCTILTSITLPSSMTVIQTGMFSDCSSLTGVTIPSSVTTINGSAFRNCTSITNFTIPNAVTIIPDNMFTGCSSLTDITIHSLVTTIRSYAFRNCTSITNFTIPNTITSIADNIFNGCSGLISITIPNTVTSITTGMFNGCSSLTSITIPSSVTSINNYAFNNCSSLASITIPNTVTSIGNSFIFTGCTSLSSITFNSYLTNSQTLIGQIPSTQLSVSFSYSGVISDNVCINKTNLVTVTIGNQITSIGSSSFSGCTGLTSITIPTSVTSIGSSSFSGCTGLTSITIPSSVTSISDNVFSGCTGLTSITIPTSVTSIGSSSFSGCTGLTSITIPSSVTSIANGAFQLCNAMTSVTFLGNIPVIDGINFTAENDTVYYTVDALNTDILSQFFTTQTQLADPNAPPDTPTITSITVSQTTATINFSQSSNSSSSVNSYKYATSTDGTTYSSFVTSNWTTGTSFTVSSLAIGTYYFKIIANNGKDSDASNASSAVTVSNFAPATPSISNITVSQTTATINFTQSSNSSNAVTSYKYATSTDGITYSSFVTSNWTTGTSFTVSSLTVGTTYYFKIMANNGIDSAASSASSAVTVSNFAPATPSISSITVSQTTATINFTQSSNGSSSVTNYKYATSTNGITYSSFVNSNWTSGTSLSISNLNVGTYYFKIIANNGIDSAASSASSAVSVSNFAPVTPSISSVTVSQTNATINFTQSSNGSNTVNSYKYATSTNGTTYSSFVNSNWTTGTSFTVSNLTIGTTYYFKIIANNGIDSAASNASSAVSISNFAPATPIITAISSSGRTVTITFTQSSNSSNTITSYKYATSTDGITYNSFVNSSWTSGTSLSISNFNAGTYYFKIVANNGIDSDESNASNAVTISNFAPSAPSISSITVSQTTATINFNASSFNGSAAVTSYKYSYSTVSDSSGYVFFTTSNWTSGTSFTVSGLTVGSTYYFKIMANNGIDSAESSASNAVNILNFAPVTPTITSVSSSGRTVTINFTQDLNGSNAVSIYKYATSNDGTTYNSFVNSSWTSGTSLLISNLNIGTYYFKIIANNGIDSTASNASTAVSISNFAPNAPIITSVSVSETTATINFTQSSNGSNTVNRYKYATSTNGTTYSSYTTSNWTSGTSFTVPSLTIGTTYYFKIIANNGIDSTESTASNAVTVSNFAPNAPIITGVSVSVSQETVTINFTQSSNGSNAVTNYKYTTSNDGSNYSSTPTADNLSWTQGSTSLTISKLARGNNYWFKLYANNGIDSIASDASNSVLLQDRPFQPTLNSITWSNNVITIQFSQISNSAIITGYTYSFNNGGSNYPSFTNANLSWTTGTLSLTISNMPTSAEYNFKLKSVSSFFNSNESNVIKYTRPETTGLTATVSSATGNIVYIRNNANIIQYSTNSRTSWINLNWPFVIGNTSSSSVLTVNIDSDLTITGPNNDLFVFLGNKITVEGGNKNITINNFSDFPGLFKNGSASSTGKNSITIQNINVISSGSTTLLSGEGWICRSYFGNGSTDNLIQNCSSNGVITSSSGGIAGSYIASNSTNFKIYNCNAYGNISDDSNGDGAGGIVGSLACSNTTNSQSITIDKCNYTGNINGYSSGGIIGSYSSYATITNCVTTGIIRNGGIAGRYAGYKGLVTISLCRTDGDIGCSINANKENFAGGIVGDYAKTVTINKCYSQGAIGIRDNDNSPAGGIIGAYAGFDNGQISIIDCFSVGDIYKNCGGIAGPFFGIKAGKAFDVTRCYSIGEIGANAGGLFANGLGQNAAYTIRINNCGSIGRITQSDSGGIMSRQTFVLSKDNSNSITVQVRDSVSYGQFDARNGNGYIGYGSDASWISSSEGIKINPFATNNKAWNINFNLYPVPSLNLRSSGIITYYTFFSKMKQITRQNKIWLLGWTIGDFAYNGYSAMDLRNAGATVAMLRTNGKVKYTVYELYDESWGYSLSEIYKGGMSITDINALYVNGVKAFTTSDYASVPVSAFDMKTIGYTASQLKALNIYRLQDFVSAGFTREEMRDAGWGVKDFLSIGVTKKTMYTGGLYTEEELKGNGYTANDIVSVNGNASVEAYENAGVTVDDYWVYVIDIQQELRVKKQYDLTDINPFKHSLFSLMNDKFLTIFNNYENRIVSGYIPADFIAAGFTKNQILSITQTKHNGNNPSSVAGYPLQLLLHAGFTASDFKTAISRNIGQFNSTNGENRNMSSISALSAADRNIIADYSRNTTNQQNSLEKALNVSMSSAEFNNGVVLTSQPPPNISDIITYRNQIHAKIAISDTNTSPDIINYTYSTNLNSTFTNTNLVQLGKTLIISGVNNDQGQQIPLNTVSYKSNNGTLGDLNTLLNFTVRYLQNNDDTTTDSTVISGVNIGDRGTALINFATKPQKESRPTSYAVTITNYAVSINGGEFNLLDPPQTTSPLIIKNLVEGRTYNFQIRPYAPQKTTKGTKTTNNTCKNTYTSYKNNECTIGIYGDVSNTIERYIDFPKPMPILKTTTPSKGIIDFEVGVKTNNSSDIQNWEYSLDNKTYQSISLKSGESNKFSISGLSSGSYGLYFRNKNQSFTSNISSLTKKITVPKK
jgi:hypothetical protein